MQLDVWEGYTGLPADTLDMEIYQPWLEPATAEDMAAQEVRPGSHWLSGILTPGFQQPQATHHQWCQSGCSQQSRARLA